LLWGGLEQQGMSVNALVKKKKDPSFLGFITFAGGAMACCLGRRGSGWKGGEDVIWTAFHVETSGSFTKHVTVPPAAWQTRGCYTDHV
jgi:hypothetical protein